MKDLVETLRAAGVSDAKIIERLIAREEERLAKKRARTAKWRNNKEDRDACDVTDARDVTRARVEGSSSSSEITGFKRGSRLSPDWEISSDDAAFAAAKGMSSEAISRTAFVFKNYWLAKPGKDGAKLDWSRTWQNWVVKELSSAAAKPVRRDSYGIIIH